MKYLEVEIPEETGYLIPIGDLHIGDIAFKKYGEQKLIEYLEWVKETPNSKVFLNGDIFNVAGREEKTSPFGTEVDENGQITEFTRALNLFKPYAKQIIGATDGNHEARLIDKYGMSPLQHLCMALDIPYCNWSALIRFKVGKITDPSAGNRFVQNYYVYMHHTTGGGGSIGSKMNRVVKLRDIIEGIDVYCGSHNHQLAAAPQDVYYPSDAGPAKRRIWYVDCGSYLGWEGSYAEKAMMPPAKLGSPKIRFDGRQLKHDIHISL